MKTVTGKFNTAKVFTDVVEEKSLQQIQTLCDQEFTSGEKIRLMPDVHAGAGCTIGTTMTISDKIVPNLVGVDIGCGMETLVIHKDSIRRETLIQLSLIKVSRKISPADLTCGSSCMILLRKLNGIKSREAEDGCHFQSVSTGSRHNGFLKAIFLLKKTVALLCKKTITR